MTQDEFLRALDANKAIVDTWPEWKRNIIRDSLSPTVPVPRTPVDNFRDNRLSTKETNQVTDQPTPSDDRLSEPGTVEYWKKASRDRQAQWPDRLLYMEQAFNHALNWAYALREMILEKAAHELGRALVVHWETKVKRLAAERANLIERNQILRDRPDLDLNEMKNRLARLELLKRYDQLEQLAGIAVPAMETARTMLRELVSNGMKLTGVEDLARGALDPIDDALKTLEQAPPSFDAPPRRCDV